MRFCILWPAHVGPIARLPCCGLRRCAGTTGSWLHGRTRHGAVTCAAARPSGASSRTRGLLPARFAPSSAEILEMAPTVVVYTPLTSGVAPNSCNKPLLARLGTFRVHCEAAVASEAHTPVRSPAGLQRAPPKTDNHSGSTHSTSSKVRGGRCGGWPGGLAGHRLSVYSSANRPEPRLPKAQSKAPCDSAPSRSPGPRLTVYATVFNTRCGPSDPATRLGRVRSPG